MVPATLLRLLAINDETAPALTTDLIEIVNVADGEGGEADRVSHWLQHVYLLGTEEPVTFDLLFIDIRFHEDRYAPQYGDGKVNPLGLLHALTFAARQDPSQSPFIWGYHSGDPESVKDDPVAIIAFSLLSALEQRGETGDVTVGGRPWKWNDVGIHNVPEAAIKHYSKAIAGLPRGGGEIIWKEMVRRYRRKFLDYVDNERMFLDQDQVGLLLGLAQSGSQAGRKKLASAALELCGPPGRRWTRRLLLQSFFADELIDQNDEWPEGKPLKELVGFLGSLKKMGLSGGTDYWLPRVKEIMALVNTDKPILRGITPLRARRCLGALAILCWWLEQKASKTPCNTNLLLESFGYYSAHRKVLEGCLASLGYTSLAEFFEYLDGTSERLPSPFYSVGRKWWTTVCKQDAATAPKCIS